MTLPSLGRIVTIQRNEKVADGMFGGFKNVWVDLATVWAHVDQTGVSEKFINSVSVSIAKRNASITIRWRGDVTEVMRVIYDGLAWDIEGIGEVGQRRGLTLYVQSDPTRAYTP